MRCAEALADLERLIEKAEAASDGEAVHRVAHDEQVDIAQLRLVLAAYFDKERVEVDVHHADRQIRLRSTINLDSVACPVGEP